jgi:nuclear GTP-binding protein
MQEVVLDRNVRLIDSPGVVFDDSENMNNGASTVLRNCIDADSVEDPIPAVQALLDRCTTESLMMTYSVPAFPKGNVMMFLAMIAKRNGKVLKGGIPDKVTAARMVIRDWNSGKIPYFTKPPSIKEENNSIVHNDAKIVSGFGEAFDVNKLDEAVMKSLKNKDEMDFVQMETEAMDVTDEMETASAIAFLTGKEEEGEDIDEDDDDDMEMEEEMDDSSPNKTLVMTNAVAADAEDYDFGGN